MLAASAIFRPSLLRWSLQPDGDPIVTRGSRLLPVRSADGRPAMLKIAQADEERLGHVLLRWWRGDGAARVLAQADDATLLERATGTRSLARMARDGRDDEAGRILCGVAARLHAPRATPWPELVPLAHWFRALAPVADAQGERLRTAAGIARALLDDPHDVRPLHGDLHHDNVLDFGPGRGWLAIDPKGLVGERGYDFANLFRNPDPDAPLAKAVALRPGLFERRLATVAAAADLERGRLLRWIIAQTGLSAAWIIDDGDDPAFDLAILDMALQSLDGATA